MFPAAFRRLFVTNGLLLCRFTLFYRGFYFICHDTLPLLLKPGTGKPVTHWREVWFPEFLSTGYILRRPHGSLSRNKRLFYRLLLYRRLRRCPALSCHTLLHQILLCQLRINTDLLTLH